MPVHISSEIGRLRGVVVHTPGRELLAVTPSTREDYLYDDIIDADAAQREHRRFIALLERFATVYQVSDLLEQVLASSAARELLIRATMDIVPSEPLARDLTALDPSALARMLIEGREEAPGPLAKALNEPGYTLPPLPNLFFTRDSAMVAGDHVLVGSMRYGIRWPEELIMKSLFTHHPALATDDPHLGDAGMASCSMARRSAGRTTRSKGATSTRCAATSWSSASASAPVRRPSTSWRRCSSSRRRSPTSSWW